jgi:hypothetical protein
MKEYPENYIPETLEDAIEFLDAVQSDEEKAAIQTIALTTEGHCYCFGMGMRNSWGLWQRSPLALWFRSIGIQHADDMSGIIGTCYRRHLDGLPYDLEKQVEFFRKFWRDGGYDPDNMCPLPDEEVSVEVFVSPRDETDQNTEQELVAVKGVVLQTALANPKHTRWVFVSDDSCHNYLIPTTFHKEFNRWIAWEESHHDDIADAIGEGLPDWSGTDFHQWRIDGIEGCWTFTDPRKID